MNINAPTATRYNVPQANSYRMGVQDSFQAQVKYPIDSRDEHRAQTTFNAVKAQQNELASFMTSIDNTRQDRDPRPGQVTRVYRGYENGTGNFIDEKVNFSYSTSTGVPLNLSAQGRYSTNQGTIEMDKQVGWDSHGQTFFQDTRQHSNIFGNPTGSESVRGFEYTAGPNEPSGLEYEQRLRGWLVPY